MTGHFPNNRVWDSLDKQHRGSKMQEIVNTQIFDACQIPNSPEPFADVPGVRLLKCLYVAVPDVWTGWE